VNRTKVPQRGLKTKEMTNIRVCVCVSTCQASLLYNFYRPIKRRVTGWAVAGSKTPEGIATTLGVRDYIGDPTLTSKYGSYRAAWGVSAHARNIILIYSIMMYDDCVLSIVHHDFAGGPR